MRKKLYIIVIMMVFIFIGLFMIKSETIANSSDTHGTVSSNIEALLFIDPIGRSCNDGCQVTGNTHDACEQCGESRCYTYLGRKPIGMAGSCPVHQE